MFDAKVNHVLKDVESTSLSSCNNKREILTQSEESMKELEKM